MCSTSPSRFPTSGRHRLERDYGSGASRDIENDERSIMSTHPLAAGTAAAAEAMAANAGKHDVLTLGEIEWSDAGALLARYGLRLERVEDGTAIPGSFWGESEAGLIGTTVYARRDTPVHSLLHEACHLIVLPPERRLEVHTDATDSDEEEDAVCVLQTLLGDVLPGVGRDCILADMDAWGYSFRLGSAKAYVEQDAESAWRWLAAHGLIDSRTRELIAT
jgi:hypothetical protein